ncbi:hypothetical protein D3C72_958120 [compost metagenome]
MEPKDIQQERQYLDEMGQTLNSALFIVDRLIEEIREEEGRLDNDPQIGRLFTHLNIHLGNIDRMIRRRHDRLGDLLNEERKKEKGSLHSSPPTKSI